jgi:hypothetical protein
MFCFCFDFVIPGRAFARAWNPYSLWQGFIMKQQHREYGFRACAKRRISDVQLHIGE